MTTEARSRQALFDALNWEPLFGTPRTRVEQVRQGAAIERTLDRRSDRPNIVRMNQQPGFAHDSLAITSLAVNGSVKRNDAAMACAAANIAQWKTYLPEDCVKAMMTGGWHWST
jgi:hypothetical protein